MDHQLLLFVHSKSHDPDTSIMTRTPVSPYPKRMNFFEIHIQAICNTNLKQATKSGSCTSWCAKNKIKWIVKCGWRSCEACLECVGKWYSVYEEACLECVGKWYSVYETREGIVSIHGKPSYLSTWMGWEPSTSGGVNPSLTKYTVVIESLKTMDMILHYFLQL